MATNLNLNSMLSMRQAAIIGGVKTAAQVEPELVHAPSTVAPTGIVKRLNRDQVLIGGLANDTETSLDAKALLHVLRIGEPIGLDAPEDILIPMVGVKVGSVGSHSRGVQAAQAAASTLIPGDMSDIRSPIRSAAWEAITPGGGRDRRNRLRTIGRNVVRRCPPGYEYGGRFTNAAFSNCGSLIFELVDGSGVGEGMEGSATRGGARRTGDGIGGGAAARVVGAGEYGTSPIQRRAAMTPPVGGSNPNKRRSAVEAAVVAAGAAREGFKRIVRKDGVAFTPLASVEKLSRQKNHPEMTGSVLVIAATKPSAIGGDELRLLGNGLSEIMYVVPGGHTFTVKPKKTIAPRRASALRRELMSLRSGEDDDARALKTLAEKNSSELTFIARYKNLAGANDMVIMERNGVRRHVQKWAYWTWYSSNAPGRVRTSSAWRLVEED